MNDLIAAERGRRNLRIALFVIILATLPFYCFGIVLLMNPAARSVTATPEPINTQVIVPTNTVPGFPTALPQQNSSTLAPTPGQFIPPTVVRFITPTFFIPTAQPTTFVFPTLTPAPSLTPFPSDTPFPSITPFPTSTPYPTLTNTFIVLPTLTDTIIPQPTDTETPTPTLEVLSP